MKVVLGTDAVSIGAAIRLVARLFAFSCLVVLFTFGPIPRSHAQATALTVGVIADRLHHLIDDANRAASDLLQQGNTAAAEQQFLLAGLLQGTLDQIQRAYGSQMRSTVESIGGVETDAFQNLNKSLENVRDLETKTVSDLEAVVQQAQSAGNQRFCGIVREGKNIWSGRVWLPFPGLLSATLTLTWERPSGLGWASSLTDKLTPNKPLTWTLGLLSFQNGTSSSVIP